MFSTNGGSETTYSGLNTAITNAGSYNQDGYLGCYWSSSLKTDYIETAYCLTFSNYSVLPGNWNNRSGGLPIRPFKDIDD